MITALLSLTSRSSNTKTSLELLTSILLLAICIVCPACAKRETALVEQAPAYQASPSPENASQLNLPKVTAPKPGEVQDAVKRVFKDVAVVDTTATPHFIVGDFNGDASQDLAVVVKPAMGKLEALNEEYPAWLLRDPFARAPSSDPQLRVSENETLLAVIHGYGPNEWRDQQATQTFLLKNSAGQNLESTSNVDFVKSNSGRRIPRLRGDVISEVVRGTQGCLYFSSATYRWYDPQTFRGETDPRSTVHGRMGQVAK
jgi:hypothetical protein